MDSTTFSLITVVLIMIGTGGYFLFQQNQIAVRARLMQALAERIGFHFLTGIPLSQAGSISTSALLKKCDHGRLNHFMYGQTDQARLQIFDHEYTIQSSVYGRTRTTWTYRQTVVAMTFTGTELVPFKLKPENLFHRFGHWLGDQDIDFRRHPDFSNKYVLESHDRQQVREFLDDELLDFLTDCDLPHFECTRTAFLLYQPETILSVDQIETSMRQAYAIYQALLDRQRRR